MGFYILCRNYHLKKSLFHRTIHCLVQSIKIRKITCFWQILVVWFGKNSDSFINPLKLDFCSDHYYENSLVEVTHVTHIAIFSAKFPVPISLVCQQYLTNLITFTSEGLFLLASRTPQKSLGFHPTDWQFHLSFFVTPHLWLWMQEDLILGRLSHLHLLCWWSSLGSRL